MSELCRSNISFNLAVNKIPKVKQYRVIARSYMNSYSIEERTIRVNICNQSGKTVGKWKTLERKTSSHLSDVMFEFSLLTQKQYQEVKNTIEY